MQSNLCDYAQDVAEASIKQKSQQVLPVHVQLDGVMQPLVDTG